MEVLSENRNASIPSSEEVGKLTTSLSNIPLQEFALCLELDRHRRWYILFHLSLDFIEVSLELGNLQREFNSGIAFDSLLETLDVISPLSKSFSETCNVCSDLHVYVFHYLRW